MKSISISVVILFILAGAFALAGNIKQKYDKDRWLKNSLRLEGRLNGNPIDKLAADYIVSLPREIQIDPDSAVIIGSQWAYVSDDETVVIIFTGGMRNGTKVLDLRGR